MEEQDVRFFLLLFLKGHHIVAPDCKTVRRIFELFDQQLIAQSRSEVVLQLRRVSTPASPRDEGWAGKLR